MKKLLKQLPLLPRPVSDISLQRRRVLTAKLKESIREKVSEKGLTFFMLPTSKAKMPANKKVRDAVCFLMGTFFRRVILSPQRC